MKNNRKTKSNKTKNKSRKGMQGYPPLSEQQNLTLSTTYRWNTTVSAGSITNATVNLSDLNEFQPYYYDQLLTIYKNWVVMGAEIEYRVVNRSSSYDGQLIAFEINRKNYDSGLTLPISESLPGSERHFISSTGKDKTLVIRRYVNLTKFYPSKYSDDSDFWGDLYNSPNICSETVKKMNMYSVLLYSAADGTNAVQFTTDRRVKFHIRFFSFWYQNISADSQFLSVEDPASKPPRDEPVKITEVPVKVAVCSGGVRKFVSDGPRSVR